MNTLPEGQVRHQDISVACSYELYVPGLQGLLLSPSHHPPGKQISSVFEENLYGHVNIVHMMQFINAISRNTQSKTYMLSLTECVWEFQNHALWDTHWHVLLGEGVSAQSSNQMELKNCVIKLRTKCYSCIGIHNLQSGAYISKNYTHYYLPDWAYLGQKLSQNIVIVWSEPKLKVIIELSTFQNFNIDASFGLIYEFFLNFLFFGVICLIRGTICDAVDWKNLFAWAGLSIVVGKPLQQLHMSSRAQRTHLLWRSGCGPTWRTHLLLRSGCGLTWRTHPLWRSRCGTAYSANKTSFTRETRQRARWWVFSSWTFIPWINWK